MTLGALAAPDEDLELAYLKRKFGGDFQGALREAFGLLTPRERNVIRHYPATACRSTNWAACGGRPECPSPRGTLSGYPLNKADHEWMQ